MKYSGFATLLAVTLLAAPSIALAAPPATYWITETMIADMNACLVRGQSSHTRAGSTSITVSDRDVRGYRGDTVGVIVCLPAQDLAFIYTAGPNGNEAQLYRNALRGGL